MRLLKDKLKLRLYQQTILSTAKGRNTLVVLPTGLGKTHIAIALAGLKVRKGKILMLAPTKPLILQHMKTFARYFEFGPGELAVLSGELKPDQRVNAWKSAQIIFSTPQTIKNDIIAGRIRLKDVALVIFDEAHRAVGDYAYVFIAKDYVRQAAQPHILALTASPGNQSNINQIKANLFIEAVEVRGRSHPEVKDYIQPIVIEHKIVQFPKELQPIREHIKSAIKDRLGELKALGLISSTDRRKINIKSLIALQGQLQSKITENKFEITKGLSLCAALLKLYHILGLLESESLSAAQKYLQNLWDSARKTRVRAVHDLVNDFHVRAAFARLSQALAEGKEHPKLAMLRDLIREQYARKPNSRTLIFTESRANISQIMFALERLENVEPHKFIGQASREEKGMSQKTQAEIIDRFERGELNCLVCTSVAEEGLDLPSVDLVIFYSPIPSAIRSIQRRGRTGRHDVGRVIILITKDSSDESALWASRRREFEIERTLNSEKLAEQPLNFFEKRECESELKIYADARERGKIVDLLYDKGVKIELANLEVGDFVLSEDVCIERKSVADFVGSIIDGRLFEQIAKLKAKYPSPLLVVEGDVKELFAIRRVHPSAIWGAFAAIGLDWKIPVIFTAGPVQTAELLYTIIKREQLDKKKAVALRTGLKPSALPEAQQFFIEGLPNVGPRLAKALLEHFGCPRAVIDAPKDQLKKIEGIGEKKASAIRELLDSEYNEG